APTGGALRVVRAAASSRLATAMTQGRVVGTTACASRNRISAFPDLISRARRPSTNSYAPTPARPFRYIVASEPGGHGAFVMSPTVIVIADPFVVYVPDPVLQSAFSCNCPPLLNASV